MKKILLQCFLLTLFVLLGLHNIIQCETDDLSSKLKTYMEQKVKNNNFNGCVLVSKGNKRLIFKAYGWANMEHKVPNTIKTKFRIGSVSKQFTAMAIMILEERRKLKVKDNIKKLTRKFNSAQYTFK